MARKMGIVNLSTIANREVENDVISITFSVTKEGTDSNIVQEELKTALETALVFVRPVVSSEVEVETGAFHVGPRYDAKNKPNGYTGYTSLIVKGTDTKSISQLSSMMTTMTIAGVGHELSQKKRESLEDELIAEAVNTFHEKAENAAHLFYADTYDVKEVTISVQRSLGGVAQGARLVGAALSSPLPIESGKSTVGVTVNGSIRLRDET